ncbi:MAG: hypothetical protein K2X00_12820 [Nitrospiraceae bacterium]|nr:hypothetical protein [Nitrospiraceae bacterium]OQW64645.1 MAG: hypothetical protein BVN29_12610 [Nitrospira sp. ST-bin5]
MSSIGLSHMLYRDRAMPDRMTSVGRLEDVVSTAEDFDRVVLQSLPLLLDRAAGYTKRFLRETGQWSDDVAHEKFVLRWGAEYLEQFLVSGRSEVPCRPLFLLDSMVARQHSRPEPFCYHRDLLTPLGRFLDGLVGRAVVSRDALIALYHHCYGLGPGQVITALRLNGSESPRIYKNFQRWRESGWKRTLDDIGFTDADLQGLTEQQQRHRFNGEAERLLRFAQTHYRKSEPDHYPCLPRHQWEDMFLQGYGVEYRIWHLALCLDCLQLAWDLGLDGASAKEKPRVTLQLQP